MIKNLKILIINLFFFLFAFHYNAFAKNLPPGAGASVPVNILILLDTSESMVNKPFGGDALDPVGDLILLNDGDVIIGQDKNAGVVKMDYTTEELDTSFAGGAARFGGGGKKNCTLDGVNNVNLKDVYSMDISSDVDGVSAGEEVIYMAAHEDEKVVAIDSDGNCIEVITNTELGKSNTGKFDALRPEALTIRTINAEDHLIVTGREWWCTKIKKKKKKQSCKKSQNRAFMYSRNLTTGKSRHCTISNTYKSLIFDTRSITMDNGNYLFSVVGSKIWRMPMKYNGQTYCPEGNTTWNYKQSGSYKSDYNGATHIDVDPQDDSVMYLTSYSTSSLQKLTFSDAVTDSGDKKILTASITVGGSEESEATPAGASASDESSSINIYRPRALFVGNDRVWTGGMKVSVQEYDISSNRIKWVDEMGTTRLNRAQGAAKAIEAIVTDSSLLEGARFGYGYWNAGVENCKKGKAAWLWGKNCEYACNKDCPIGKGKPKYWRCNDNCNYYQGWAGEHPAGRSNLCNKHSCLAVGIDKNNTNKIKNELDRMTLQFGTDAHAFAQLASEYYRDAKVLDREKQPLAPPEAENRLDCQLNYVIVIGDGKWRHHDEAYSKIQKLRQDLGVKTIVVAYGDGISADGLENFNDMALAGSCDDPTGNHTDCRGRLDAKTPADLLTKLKSEVERIIASRLSFTAPSITASIQEGGDLYQAQFEFVKHGEWQGSLLRKKIRADGSVVHADGAEGNYDVADKVRQQAVGGTRNIWTVMPEQDYITQKWNNFTTANKSDINKLFGLLGDRVADYHNTSSTCAEGKTAAELTSANILDGNSDDIEGLISFVRGKDYFAYEGCDNTKNVRKSVLGDIYHSQIVEVGKPKANTNFTRNNQEAYWRSINSYGSWAKSTIRDKVMYVGANDGALHAFRTTGAAGEELWAFVPPFVAAKLPSIVNEGLDGINGKGGSNSIFAVDGSPVIHDVFINGLNRDGTYQDPDGNKSWHTILMVTYGRGGEGFSVLDITYPEEPLHMFSVFNDRVNNIVYIADKDGNLKKHSYSTGTLKISESLEAQRADRNQQEAYDTDIDGDPTGETTTARDNIATCQSDADITTGTGKFRYDGTAACYKGSTFTFLYDLPAEIISDPSLATVQEWDADRRIIESSPTTITKAGSEVTFTLDTGEGGSSIKVYNASTSDTSDLDETFFSIRISSAGTDDKDYNYSTLGETWAAPRIIRMPQGNTASDTISTDVYVAVLTGGYGAANGVGSSLFLIDLEDTEINGGKIYGAEENNGPITLVDLNTTEKNSDGDVEYPDIHNSVPTDPIVITPDTFKGADWRGAMVYLNDFEGKITKINLTNQRGEDVNLFDQTTLFNLDATTENGRYSYFGMDAAYGHDTQNLWLFGSTGDFADIGAKHRGMDNILYGIRDRDFPKFKHIGQPTPSAIVEDSTTEELGINPEYKKILLENALAAPTIDSEIVCAHTKNHKGGCPGQTKEAWVFKLDDPYYKEYDSVPGTGGYNFYRKASASPTVFRGTVYYPVYEPPSGAKKCNVGKAFICSADDECGINNSENIANAQKTVREDSGFDDGSLTEETRTASECYYLQPGILSKLVVFGDTLFANITTSSAEQEDTLVTLLAGEGEISVYRGSWRENY